MMRLTGQKIFDATQILATIINEKRSMPGKGVYRVTKMHKALFDEFSVLNEQRTAKIMTYDHKNEADQPAVPDDKMPEFVAWWNEIASVESDVNIEPIPIDQFCIDGANSSISFAEFAVLGDLVKDG